MSSKKQTAVEWLMEQILPTISIRLSDTYIKELTNQSKAMEKEQIINAYRDGRTDQSTSVPKFYNRSSAIYYTSTYGS
jgi:hypothetical protein